MRLETSPIQYQFFETGTSGHRTTAMPFVSLRLSVSFGHADLFLSVFEIRRETALS